MHEAEREIGKAVSRIYGLDQADHLPRAWCGYEVDSESSHSLQADHPSVPHEKWILPDNYRGMFALLRYDDGAEKCVRCDLCEAACPSRVIAVVSAEVPAEPTKRYAREYSMDMTRCLFCGLCVQACPVDPLR